MLLAAVLLATIAAGPADAARHHRKTAHVRAVQPDRFAEIVIDAQTGFVLSEKNPDKRLYPASMTKMMTLYLAFEAIEGGQMTKSQRVPVSANAQYQEPSKLGLEAGYSIRVEDLILGIVTRSANDAAVTLGEAVGGSESRFARMMTLKAQQLGMKNTHFVNASGLHDPDQYSSARDMAILAQALMRDFPRQYHYFSTPSFTYAGVTSLNHNKLLKTYEGCDGMKTGYVYASGYNLTASAVQGGHRLIGVIFGGRTAAVRNKTMEDLLDAGFAKIADPRVAALIQHRTELAKGTAPKAAAGAAQKIVSYSQTQLAARTQGSLEAAGVNNNAYDDVEEGDAGLSADMPAANAMTAVAQRQTAAAPQAAVQQQPAAKPGQIAARTATAVPAAPAIAAPRAPVAPVRVAVAPPARVAPAAVARVAPAPVLTAPAAGQPVRMAMATAPELIAPAIPGSVSGTWAVQVGAFATHQAGVTALKQAASKLPKATMERSKYVIVPLMTNRGMIYRARLGGLDRGAAATACKVLRGSCLVLALE